LFSDSSHELATSLLPTFLTVSLHAGPAALGVIEGTSDALTGFSKLIGGPLANDPRRRGRLASGGYLGTAVATAAIGLTTAVWQVAVLRAFAWISRGIRSPSRDMLLTSLVTKKTYRRAFGIERAGDNAGAILGPVLASLLVDWWVCGPRSCCLSFPASWPRSRSPWPRERRDGRSGRGRSAGPCTCNCAGSGAPVSAGCSYP
jgi:MFS family permease